MGVSGGVLVVGGWSISDLGLTIYFHSEIKWTDEYPTELPALSLDSFYNKHLVPEVKISIIKAVTGQINLMNSNDLVIHFVTEEAEQFLGMSMTYSLFEWVRESIETLLENQPETIQTVCEEIETKCSVTEETEADQNTAKAKVKKEQLTKAQKRAQWKKGGLNEDDRERGWNWVDIVRHLSQTANTD